MSILRQKLKPVVADNAYMRLSADLHLDAINVPMRPRRASLSLDYTSHAPKVFLNVAGELPVLWYSNDTRRRTSYRHALATGQAQIVADDIHERLAKIEASLILVVDTPRQGPKIAKFQVHNRNSRILAFTLAEAPKGRHIRNFKDFEEETC